MELNRIKIVADSSADLAQLDGVSFESVPLKIITDEKQYVDNEELDVYGMVEELSKYKGRSSTSCPNADDWLRAFGDAEWVFCVTITGTLSGSCNAARAAASIYEETYPDRRVFVLDSLSTGPETALMIDKIREAVLSGADFDGVCEAVSSYSKGTGLLFMLESMRNLANNGRVNPIVAKMAGILGIRVVGMASERGDLSVLDKCRGELKALEALVAHMKEMGLEKGRVWIAHCFNEDAATSLKDMIKKDFSKVKVKLYRCRGLCSFYAERGGLLVGFEKA